MSVAMVYQQVKMSSSGRASTKLCRDATGAWSWASEAAPLAKSATVSPDNAEPLVPPMTDKTRRNRLRLLHTICFIIHTTAAVSIASVGAGKDMKVEIVRIKANWENPAGGMRRLP